MSKFQEACQSFAGFESRLREYRDDILAIGHTFYRGFISYFDVPREYIHIVPSSQSEWTGGTSSVLAAASLGENGFYEYKIILELEEAAGVQPRQPIAFVVKLKKLNGLVIIKIGNLPEHRIEYVSPETLAPIYEQMFTSLTAFYSASLDTVFSSNTPRKIGFI